MDKEQYLAQPRLDPKEGEVPLPNGCGLIWKENDVGGRVYYSDEVGGGVVVWDTSLVDDSTLLAALTQELTLRVAETMRALP